MKSIVFLYAGFTSEKPFEPVFAGQSAFERVLLWADDINDCVEKVVFALPCNEEKLRRVFEEKNCSEYKILKSDSWTLVKVLEKAAVELASKNADCGVFAGASEPFLDRELTQELLKTHSEYLAEYTFQDGYAAGFAPQIVDKGALNIMVTLAKDSKADEGNKSYSKDSIFNLIRQDINSFDVETVIASKDYRHLRLNLECETKSGFIACKKLWKKALDYKTPFTVDELSALCEKETDIQKTVPSFYEIELTPFVTSNFKYSITQKLFEKRSEKLKTSVYLKNVNDEVLQNQRMSLEHFEALTDEMNSFSENAVVSLSAFGEPMLLENIEEYISRVLKHKGLSVLIETCGLNITEEKISKIKNVCDGFEERTNGYEKIIWIVNVDAFTAGKYVSMHECAENIQSNFETAVNCIGLISKYFSGSVYPQFNRVKENEDELEQFFRYFHDKNSSSQGKLIIQKYNSFCKTLSDEKPCDLSPLTRIPCWHLKRDMVVLYDGSVPVCKSRVLENCIGNVFDSGIEKVWQLTNELCRNHIEKNYDNLCGNCDEYYTFNF